MKTPADLVIHLFEGRVSRKTFLLSHLSLVVGYFLSTPLLILLGKVTDLLDISVSEPVQKVFITLFGIVIVVLFLFISFMHMSLTIRRLHDCNKSGWNYLFVLIPYVGVLIVFIYSRLKKGDTKENKYGKTKNRTLISEIFNLSK